MVQSVITSVVVATLLSAGGVFVSVKVMGSELDRAQRDLEATAATVTTNREELIGLKAAKKVADERDVERWEAVKTELENIRVIQGQILGALPDRWRSSDQPGR